MKASLNSLTASINKYGDIAMYPEFFEVIHSLTSNGYIRIAYSDDTKKKSYTSKSSVFNVNNISKRFDIDNKNWIYEMSYIDIGDIGTNIKAKNKFYYTIKKIAAKQNYKWAKSIVDIK